MLEKVWLAGDEEETTTKLTFFWSINWQLWKLPNFPRDIFMLYQNKINKLVSTFISIVLAVTLRGSSYPRWCQDPRHWSGNWQSDLDPVGDNTVERSMVTWSTWIIITADHCFIIIISWSLVWVSSGTTLSEYYYNLSRPPISTPETTLCKLKHTAKIIPHNTQDPLQHILFLFTIGEKSRN